MEMSLLLAALRLATAVRADSIYDVSEVVTVPGNDACNDPCTETINLSVQLDERYSAGFLNSAGRTILGQVMVGKFEILVTTSR